MKLKLILTTAIVGAALALPSVSSAAPPAPTPPQLDDGDGLGRGVPPCTFPEFDCGRSDLRRPQRSIGENPSGTVVLVVSQSGEPWSGTSTAVDLLNVDGNRPLSNGLGPR